MFRTALTELAELTVAGVTNYDVDSLPVRVKRGQLPVLLVLPLDVDSIDIDRRLFADREGFVADSFSDGARTVTYNVTHLLLVTPLGGGRGWRDSVPALVDTIDAYLVALADSVTMGGLLLEPTQVRVSPGTYVYGDTEFIGCAFRHRWHMAI